ncbi:MAG: hypothetical protein WCA31_04745 [Acidimicrobiales bacterium]
MALFDKVKEQASQLAQKAQEAGKAGQAKIEDAQARRKADGILRQLGAAVYAQRTGTASGDNSADIDRLVGELKAFEVEHGPLASSDAADAADAASPSTSSDAAKDTDTPEGGFKL